MSRYTIGGLKTADPCRHSAVAIAYVMFPKPASYKSCSALCAFSISDGLSTMRPLFPPRLPAR